MPHFDITKSSEVVKTFRTSKIQADFDVKPEHAIEHFQGDIKLPEEWNIGVIVGGSGTGKSTIAKTVFGNDLIGNFEYSAKSVIDDMPSGIDMNEIEKAFYAVGFGSVPCWLKPYSVLSNGEKMRVDLARAMLENDFFVFDEFTSVVDRKIAETASLAIQKAVRKYGKKFVAISCHYDILPWLKPDWVFDTNKMENFFGNAHCLKNNSTSENAVMRSGQNLAVIII